MSRISRRLCFVTMFATLVATALPAAAQTTPKDALKAATDRANAIKAATGATPVATRVPPGDPCTALTPASVQSVFPGAKAERSKRLEADFGITECQWTSGAGQVVLILQETYDSGKNAKDDAIGMAQAYAGMKLSKSVRIETFPSLGVDNAAFVEPADPAHGLKNDAAFLELRKGEHDLTLAGPGFAGHDRAQTLKAFETFGRQAATRM